jgi:hypothetical protein
VIFYVAWWSRPLKQEEAAWLHAEPYAFITPAGPRVLYFADFAPVGPAAVTITAAATLPALTASATLVETFTVTGGATLPALTASATITETITGTSALVGGAAVLSGAGTLTITGAGALTAGAAALAGVGTHTAPTVPNIPGTTTGTFAPTGQTTGTFAPTGTTTGVQGP